MVGFASKVSIGDCIVHKIVSVRNHHIVAKDDVSILYCRKSFVSCCSARMNLKNSDWPDRAPIFGYFIYNALKSSWKSNIHSWFDAKELDNSSASTVAAENNPVAIFPSSYFTLSPNGKTVTSDTTLKLLSGSCCLPHPDKEDSGGEDAHFICPEEQAIGVADGVGGWAELGVDAGKYAWELMSNVMSAIREEPKGCIDPARVLEKAHSITKVKGSSTACIIALTDQLFSVPVAPGDVIIAGTDGLFDNLYNKEVAAVVVEALRAGLRPQVTAQLIAALARQRAHDKDRPTPFSTAAYAGFRYNGGKLDDITVVVSYITSCNKEDNSSPLAPC